MQVDALRLELKAATAELAATKQRLDKELRGNQMASGGGGSSGSSGSGGSPGPRTLKAGPSFASLVPGAPLGPGAAQAGPSRPPRQRVQYGHSLPGDDQGGSAAGGAAGGSEFAGGDGTLQPLTARGRATAAASYGGGDDGEEYVGGGEADLDGGPSGYRGSSKGGRVSNGGRGQGAGIEANLPPSKFRTSNSR
jgi:hypothetical protein